MAANDINITDAELEILQVLWIKAKATVKEVHEALGKSDEIRYTTVLKQMQVMHEKGLLARDDSQRQHIYTALLDQKKVQRRFTERFMSSVFGGSAAQLVLHALSNYKASTEELDEIRAMLDQAKAKAKKK